MQEKITAAPFSEEIMEAAEQMGKTLMIPSQLESPFFIARFLKAADGDEDIARTRISEYLEHRRCIGYGEYDQLGVFTEIDIGKQCFERFSISLVDQKLTSNNVHVFVQRMEGSDLKEIMKVIPLSYVIHSYFMLQDVFARAVSQTERETGKPSSVVCVLDLSGLNISDFLNPLSAPVKLARLVVKVWADYFSENMCKLVIVNPPSVISILYTVTKHIMDAKTQARIAFLSNIDELHKYLEPEVIPVAYGGCWSDNSGYSKLSETCVRVPRPVLPSEYGKPDDVWLENGILKPPASKSYTIKSFQNVEIVKKTNESGTLIWNFTTEKDVEFEIIKRESGKEKHIWPKITITSLKLPEFGSIRISSGEFVVRFTNPNSTWFPPKVSVAVEIKPE